MNYQKLYLARSLFHFTSYNQNFRLLCKKHVKMCVLLIFSIRKKLKHRLRNIGGTHTHTHTHIHTESEPS